MRLVALTAVLLSLTIVAQSIQRDIDKLDGVEWIDGVGKVKLEGALVRIKPRDIQMSPVQQNPEFFYSRFLLEAEKRSSHLGRRRAHFFFADLSVDIEKREIRGICLTKSRRVFVDFEAWQKISIPQREQLVFHELGHCLLERGHSDQRSIMRKEPIGDHEYVRNREAYIDELFSPLSRALEHWAWGAF